MIFRSQDHWRKEQGAEPDPLPLPGPSPYPHPDPGVKGTDPRIRIRTNMSRIRNTRIYTPSPGSKGVKTLFEPLRKQNQLWPAVPSNNQGKNIISYRNERLVDPTESFKFLA
jgi:hypothetical protein